MKKILSLLTAITLTASTTTSVISCGSGDSNKTKENNIIKADETATAILNKINNKELLFTSSYVDKTFKSKESEIKNAIINNGWLKTTELNRITFTSNPTFSKNVKETINFKVSQLDSKVAPLTGRIYGTAVVTELTAKQIADKISKNGNIVFNKDKIGKNINDVKEIIMRQLSEIIDPDSLTYVTFINKIIKQDLNKIDFKVSKNGETSTGSIKAKVINNKKTQNANDIAALINTKDTVYLPNYVNLDTSNALTIEQLKEGIYNSSSQEFNYDDNIIRSDLQYFSFSKQILKRGGTTKNQVEVTVTKDGITSQPVKINVSIVDDNTKIKKTYRPYIDVGQLEVQKMSLSDLYMRGVSHVMMAFIQNQVVKGKHVPAWAGDTPIFEKTTGAAQAALNYYDNQITNYQKLGGKVGISFGGANGTTIWEGQQSDEIYKNLKKIADKYHPDMYDFDIEGTGLVDKAGTKQLVLALNKLLNEKQYSNIEVGITIAADPGLETGLNPQFNDWVPNKPLTLDSTCGMFSYLDIPTKPIVDVMAMDYGTVSWITPFGNGVRGARMFYGATLLPDKISKSIYDVWKLNPNYKGSVAEIRNNFGITPMIGVNDVQGEIFFKEDAAKLSQWSNNNNIKWIGAWSLTRDHAPQYKDGKPVGLGQLNITKSGMMQDEYQFSKVFTNLYTNPGRDKQPISPTTQLGVKQYIAAPKMVGVSWNKINNALKYKMYFDNKLVKTTLSNGAYYYDKNLTVGPHTIKVEALGVNGSSVTQEMVVNVPKPQGTEWNPTGITSTVSMFAPGINYKAGDTVICKDNGKWILRYVKSWFNGKWTEWDHKDLGGIEKFAGAYLSQQLINDLKADNIPSWFPTKTFN